MPLLRKCVTGSSLVGGVTYAGYHFYRNHKDMDKAIPVNVAHPDCNLAAARLKRAIESHSKHKTFNLQIEVDVRVNRTQSQQERELHLEKIAICIVEDAIRNAKMTVQLQRESVTNNKVSKGRKLVSAEPIETAKETVRKTKHEQKLEMTIITTARKVVTNAISSAKALVRAENLELKRAFANAAKRLVGDAISSAKQRVAAEIKREKLLAFTAKKLVANVITSVKENLAVETVEKEKALEKENSQQSTEELVNRTKSSYEGLIGATAKEELETSSENAVKEVLSNFLGKMQEVKLSPDASETDIAQTRELELEMLWPIISALSPKESTAKADLPDDEKIVRSEERFSNAAENVLAIGEDAAPGYVFDEEKTQLETGEMRHQPQPIAEEANGEAFGEFLQTMEALCAFLFTQNKSEAELQEAQKELGVLWPLLVAMRDNLPSNVPNIRPDE